MPVTASAGGGEVATRGDRGDLGEGNAPLLDGVVQPPHLRGLDGVVDDQPRQARLLAR